MRLAVTAGRVLLLAILFVGAPRASTAQPVLWTIDPGHSGAEFRVRHMLVSNVNGRFDGPGGTVTFDPKDLSTLRVDASIDARTINTGNRDRDSDLRGPLFFDTKRFPSITFQSKRTDVLAPGRFNLVGHLTLHGQTKEIVLEVEGPTAEVKDIWGNARIGATATTMIDRRDFGLMYSRLLEGGGAVVGDRVWITINLELTRPVTKKEDK